MATESGDSVLDERETLPSVPEAWRLDEFRQAWIKQICGFRQHTTCQILALQGNLIIRLVIAIERPKGPL